MDRAPRHPRATATVLERASADGQASAERRVYRYHLLVEPEDGKPYELHTEQAFWLLELKPAPGDAGVGLILAPEGVAFDLGGDPRYDADALIARTAERRRTLGGGRRAK